MAKKTFGLPEYGKNALRPNPKSADPNKGVLAFAQESILIGDFGSWDASARVTNGLPSTTPPLPGGKGVEATEPEVTRPHRNVRRPFQS